MVAERTRHPPCSPSKNVQVGERIYFYRGSYEETPLRRRETMTRPTKGPDIRSSFLNFFKENGHTIVESASLLTHDDPTLLFTNAGMNQFKDTFLGVEKRDYVRATTAQKCLRISGKHNDLENVGETARHQTFFEMLGNFSFGDYFKKEAIELAWKFSTEVLKLDKKRLWATVYEEDDEALKLWTELTDILPGRVLKCGKKDNFWAMGDTGPCGPCSELFYYVGDNVEGQSEEEFRLDDGTYLEYWNLVFMQYDRGQDGTLHPLPRPSVDTGMGLERITQIIQNVPANYDTDLLRPLIARTEKLCGVTYDGKSYEKKSLKEDLPYAQDVAFRVIADHARAIAFLIADGVQPSSDGRGFVLRRVLRRAVRHGRVLGFKDLFLGEIADEVVSLFGNQYPELQEHRERIQHLIKAEERKFRETLEQGLEFLSKQIEEVGEKKVLSGDTAFLLHDTYGFPLDLTEDALKAEGMTVDTKGFEAAMEAQRSRSRSDRASKTEELHTLRPAGEPTEFVGYEREQETSKLVQMEEGSEGSLLLLFDKTPFYAESGGQVGDTGTAYFPDSQVTVQIEDTQKAHGSYFVHKGEVVSGDRSKLRVGEMADLSVDSKRRAAIKRHHSATHLVHSALRSVLGDHVKQAGSRVDDNTLRFDFSHFEEVTPLQLQEIEQIVNDAIRDNYGVSTEVMSIDAAKDRGATALFGEKYGDEVRVVEIGPDSLELCGGTHVTRSGDIGLLLVMSEGSIAAGVHRIECQAGAALLKTLHEQRQERVTLTQLVKGDSKSLVDKIEKLVARAKDMEREMSALKEKLASQQGSDLMNEVRTTTNGLKVLVHAVKGADNNTLRTMVDQLRNSLGSGVVALAGTSDENAIFVAGVTSDLVSQVHAGNLVKEVVKVVGGRGGGRADFAQAGGIPESKVAETLEEFYRHIDKA